MKLGVLNPAMHQIEHGWLNTSRGRALLAEEVRQVRRALASAFGDQFLQIGGWGGGHFSPLARTRRQFVLSESVSRHSGLVGDPCDLPIQTDSIDVVLLPHVLETHADPHGVLREVDRVLRPDGRVIILGFNPISAWGLRYGLSGRRFPGGVRQMLTERRLCDWLRLLNLTVQESRVYFFQPPFMTREARRRQGENPRTDSRWSKTGRNLQKLASRVRPFGACYLLLARKELYTVTAIRTGWRRQKRMVGGLVNPTTRSAA